MDLLLLVRWKSSHWSSARNEKLLGCGWCDGWILPRGDVGKCIAEWIIDGEPSIDVWAMDVARFGDYASPQYGTIKSSENYERRFIMTFPNETLPKEENKKLLHYMIVL